MVTRIYYTDKNDKSYCLFDIDYYAKQANIPEEKQWNYKEQTWHLEINVCVDPRGIAHFSMDRANEKNLMEKFIKDAYEISELRGWLWEHHRRDEFYAPFKDIEKIECHSQLSKDFNKIIHDFCTLYGFTTMTD